MQNSLDSLSGNQIYGILPSLFDRLQPSQLSALKHEIEIRLTRDFLSQLPIFLVQTHLLPFLDIQSLGRCCSVCTKWNAVINKGNKALWRRACSRVGLKPPIGMDGDLEWREWLSVREKILNMRKGDLQKVWSRTAVEFPLSMQIVAIDPLFNSFKCIDPFRRDTGVVCRIVMYSPSVNLYSSINLLTLFYESVMIKKYSFAAVKINLMGSNDFGSLVECALFSETDTKLRITVAFYTGILAHFDLDWEYYYKAQDSWTEGVAEVNALPSVLSDRHANLINHIRVVHLDRRTIYASSDSNCCKVWEHCTLLHTIHSDFNFVCMQVTSQLSHSFIFVAVLSNSDTNPSFCVWKLDLSQDMIEETLIFKELNHALGNMDNDMFISPDSKLFPDNNLIVINSAVQCFGYRTTVLGRSYIVRINPITLQIDKERIRSRTDSACLPLEDSLDNSFEPQESMEFWVNSGGNLLASGDRFSVFIQRFLSLNSFPSLQNFYFSVKESFLHYSNGAKDASACTHWASRMRCKEPAHDDLNLQFPPAVYINDNWINNLNPLNMGGPVLVMATHDRAVVYSWR